jgi:ankyrin repeat protein
MSALMLAAMLNENPQVVTTLIKAGASVDERGPGGRTALMYAARFSAVPDVVSALLTGGADWKLKSEAGLAAGDYARANPSLRGTLVLRLLTPSG